MRNRLTFANALFIALLCGKLSGVGKFATMSDWVIMMPFFLDFILDFFASMGYQDKAIAWLRSKILIRQIKKAAKRTSLDKRKYP